MYGEFFKTHRVFAQFVRCFSRLGIGATPQAFGSEGIPAFVGMTERTNGARLARNGAKPDPEAMELAALARQ